MGYKFNPFTGNFDVVDGTGTSAQISTGAIIGQYKIDTFVGGDPASGYIRYNNATQISATNITIDHITDPGVDIDIFLELIKLNDRLIIQDLNESDNYQIFTVSSAPIHSGATYWTIPLTYVTSGGTGATNFSNNHQVFIAILAATSSATTSVDLVSYTQFGGF